MLIADSAGLALCEERSPPTFIAHGAGGRGSAIHLCGHIYMNLKTGERRATAFEARAGPDLWNNDDGGVVGNFFYGVDRPTRAPTDPRPRFGASVNCVGDLRHPIGQGTAIDGVGFGTATVGINSTDTVRHATAGFDMHLFFYNNDDANGTSPDTRATFVRHIKVADVPGEEGTGNAWAFTVDLAGGDEFESTYLVLAGPTFPCGLGDFNGDGFVDFTDFDDFVAAFQAGDPSSDFNADGFLDCSDVDEYVAVFETCI